MTLKIIGAGFGRTGTASVYAALNQLGYPCYHMFEVLDNKDNKSHLDFWRKVADSAPGTRQDWDQVFANYTAALDNPACCVWRELIVAYPDAKVLLTVHPAGDDAWYQSTMETIYTVESLWQFKLLSVFVPFMRKHRDMCRKLIWQRAHKGTMTDRAAAIALYHQHIEEVKAAVPADRLLVFSAKQGWKPLCDFIGVPVPDTPFPNTNDRAQMKSRLGKAKLSAYGIIGFGCAAVAGLSYGVMQWLA